MKNANNLIFIPQFATQSALLKHACVGYVEWIKIAQKIKEDLNKPINGMFESCS